MTSLLSPNQHNTTLSTRPTVSQPPLQVEVQCTQNVHLAIILGGSKHQEGSRAWPRLCPDMPQRDRILRRQTQYCHATLCCCRSRDWSQIQIIFPVSSYQLRGAFVHKVCHSRVWHGAKWQEWAVSNLFTYDTQSAQRAADNVWVSWRVRTVS